jgi:hypothetical protein
MEKRKTAWKSILGIALLAYGTSISAQDTAAVHKSSPAIAATPAGKPLVPPAQTLPKAKTTGEDILDEEDLILPEKGVDIPVKKAVADSSRKTTENAAANPAQDTGKASGDSSAIKAAETPNSGAAPAPQAVAAPAAKPAAVVKIEDARSINFARNLKEYRSPKLAMLLSLCLPGLGQVYIGKKSNYIKAGAYVAVEAAIISVSAYYFNKGDAKYNQAKNFANANYSFDAMQSYYKDLFNFFITGSQGNSGMDSATAQAALNDIYIDTLTDSKSTFSRSYNDSHPSQDYYTTIYANPKDGGSAYMHGWKDCEPTLGEIAENDTVKNPAYRYWYQRAVDSASYLVNLIDKTTGKLVGGNANEQQYGYSADQRTYSRMIDEKNKFYKYATYVLFTILINHVTSAVDALISAKAYNDGLLGRQALWENLSIEPTTAFSGQGLSPGLTMRLRF